MSIKNKRYIIHHNTVKSCTDIPDAGRWIRTCSDELGEKNAKLLWKCECCLFKTCSTLGRHQIPETNSPLDANNMPDVHQSIPDPGLLRSWKAIDGRGEIEWPGHYIVGKSVSCLYYSV